MWLSTSQKVLNGSMLKAVLKKKKPRSNGVLPFMRKQTFREEPPCES
jgi:hypothetical protein